uniref:Consortin, connexin sorting protein b n=1 Tax=Neogobius melanostomus TaxID=47308 RepID=A0A8C6V4H2_9GOBI
MGNKTSNSSSMDNDKGSAQGADFGDNGNITGSVSGDGALLPSAELLASLQSLGENQDYTLLPLSLHQIAEAYSLQEEYQWAIHFLELEKVYHERLLSNLAALQENWEGEWKQRSGAETSLSSDGESHMETLSQICRTHLSPSPSSSNVEQKTLASVSRDIQNKNDVLKTCQDDVDRLKSLLMEAKGRTQFPRSETSHDETFEEGLEVEEETTPEEELRVEWPTGVTQASEKDLAKLSNKEGNSSPDGLVSILKRRRASLDGLPPPSSTVTDQNAKRKVRFSEPDDGMEHEVGGDSCLILLLLCLVTVVISLGGTALYCTLVDTYSNICTDFTQNVDFYWSYARGVLPFRT